MWHVRMFELCQDEYAGGSTFLRLAYKHLCPKSFAYGRKGSYGKE